MNTSNLAKAAAIAVVLGVAVLSACANSSLSAGGDGPPVDTSGPSFTGADAANPTPTASDAGMCNAYECPAPYATCPGTSGLCTTDLSRDVDHCGSCDVQCPNPPPRIRQKLHASFVCAQSRCQMLCTVGFGDCNGYVEDGCEKSLDADPANCGACGNACGAGVLCWKGACGCPPGYTACGDQCVKLSDDDSNCGACGHVCDPDNAHSEVKSWPCGVDVYPPNVGFNCASSSCGLHCSSGYADCNKDTCRDGCETVLASDPENCGSCGNKCAADQVCDQGRCICDATQTRCGFDCVDLQSDPLNCGACGNACPGRVDPMSGRGSPTCVLGRCSYSCAPGFADCDHRIENGCEVDLMTDPLHCGACGAQCDLAGGQPCAAGHCLTKPCDAGVVF
ncbi:Tryptophan synthase alpha chain [Labilithrix luteola]|uniref:Tryptophan synthase alpha chain n=1 Tax=Labilithrix luteola TaxID=1391654 RepID=A0A0K1QGN8_9BACT|nr:hypothetical protein [Labilithrix luteola]AKV04600.1 Tryptophan synthase alpha chain [Labilithrix luteola]